MIHQIRADLETGQHADGGKTGDDHPQCGSCLAGITYQQAANEQQLGLQQQIASDHDLETFYAQSPAFHPNAALIKGLVCGVRVENVEDPLMQRIRYLDKLVDELAKGKAMAKILRTP